MRDLTWLYVEDADSAHRTFILIMVIKQTVRIKQENLVAKKEQQI